MIVYVRAAVFTIAATWLIVYALTVLSCRTGTDSDLGPIEKEVLQGIETPVHYWSNKISEQAIRGDETAKLTYLEVYVRPQQCAENEILPISPGHSEMKSRQNNEQGIRITPLVCPPPAVRKWCADAWFGMRSVHFQLEGDQLVFPPDVTANYCCLETHPVGRVISFLRDHFDLFTFGSVFFMSLLFSGYIFWKRQMTWRRTRDGSAMEMEPMQ